MNQRQSERCFFQNMKYYQCIQIAGEARAMRWRGFALDKGGRNDSAGLEDHRG